MGIEYQVFGNGTRVIVMHVGLGTSMNDWKLLLSKMPRNVKVLLCYRGDYGKSTNETSDKSMEQMADQLKELFEEVHITEPIILIGYSLGGLIIQEFACKYKEMVKGIILLETDLDDCFRKRKLQFPHVPLDVFTRDSEVGKDDLVDKGFTIDEAISIENDWFENQKEVSTISPYGRIIIAENSGHEIHMDAIDLILRTLEQMLLKKPERDIAYCGINCYQCPVFIATVRVDEEAKKELAARFSTKDCKLEKKDILCYGCGTRISKYNKMCIACEIKPCAQMKLNNKTDDTCASCENYPCKLIKQYISNGSVNRSLLDELQIDK